MKAVRSGRAPLGTGGRLGRLLSVPARAAWNAPWLVVGVAVATGLASAYVAMLLSPTAFTTFLPRDPSPWLYALPEPFAPGEYHFLTTAENLQTTFGYGGREGHVLVRGDVASAAALERVANGSRRAADSPLAAEGSATDSAVRTPLTVMRDVAAENESFNETYTAADITGDGVPDRNVRALYDELFRVAPDRAPPSSTGRTASTGPCWSRCRFVAAFGTTNWRPNSTGSRRRRAEAT